LGCYTHRKLQPEKEEREQRIEEKGRSRERGKDWEIRDLKGDAYL